MIEKNTHVSGEPPILCFGKPVVLISSVNESGSANLAPMAMCLGVGDRLEDD